MKKLLFIGIFILVSQALSAQQRAVFSNFLMNKYYYNPAVAGSQDVHVANLSYRNQWVGFDNAPVNVTGNVYGSLRNEGKIGYGLSLSNENSGLTNATSIYLNYAQHFKLNDKIKLGLGVQPGYLQYRVKLYDAILADAGDEILTGSVYSANAFDVNMGFNVYSKDFFVMGSIQHLLGKQLKFTSYNSNLQFHYNAIAGYNFKFDKKKIEVQPSVLLKYTKAIPLQWSVMAKTTYDHKYWLGLIYRSQDAFGVSLGILLKERFTVAYGYDFSLGGIRKHNSGSHEVMLSFIITKKKPSLEDEDDKLNNSILEKTKLPESEKTK